MKRLVLILVVLAGALAFLWQFPRGEDRREAAFLGYVEGDLLYIGPSEGERLESLAVEAGAHVEQGAPLFSIKRLLLDAQRKEASARVAQMEAQLENQRAAMNRPQQIAVFQAAVDRAQAALTLSRNDYQRQKTLFARGHISQAGLDRAAMALARDEASLIEANRQIEAGRMSGRSHEIAAAEAALAQARAQRDQLDIRVNRQSVVAPVAGVVQEVFFRPGEMVNAGQPVVSLLPPENRKARFYAPQARLAGVKLGARVKISCDGCADGLFGRVSFLSSREEYTPPVIFSDAERAKLVFKVEARLEGAARELPLGLPVSIWLWPEEGAAK